MAQLLLVDDDRDVLAVLRAGLQARGHVTISFSDPSEARAWLLTSSPDGVLLDVRMPNVTGWDLLGEIRSNKRTERLPVIMLSANGDVSERIRGLRLGADDFCVKPFHVDEVVARVEGLLARRNPARSSIQGDLATFPLADVLQSIEQQKRTGTLEISSGDSEAGASYRRGRCVDATFGALVDREALLELLFLKSGSFRFVEDPGAALDETLGDRAGPWLLRASELLLENAWLEDELARRREFVPGEEDMLALGRVPIESVKSTGLPALPFSAVAEALGAGAPQEARALRHLLGCCRARAALAFCVLLQAEALSSPPEPRDPSEGSSLPDQAALLLDRLRADVPGFLAGALVEPRARRLLGSLTLRDDFDPALAAEQACDIAPHDLSAGTQARVEDVVFILSDQLHLLLATPEGDLVFVATERSSSTNPALVRSAVTRTIRQLQARNS